MISEDLGSLTLLQDHINVAGVGPDHTLLQRCNGFGSTCCFLVDDNGRALRHPMDRGDFTCLGHVCDQLLIRGSKVESSNKHSAGTFWVLLLVALALAFSLAPVCPGEVGVPEHGHAHHHPTGVEIVVLLHHIDEALVAFNRRLVQERGSILCLLRGAVSDKGRALRDPLQVRNCAGFGAMRLQLLVGRSEIESTNENFGTRLSGRRVIVQFHLHEALVARHDAAMQIQRGLSSLSCCEGHSGSTSAPQLHGGDKAGLGEVITERILRGAEIKAAHVHSMAWLLGHRWNSTKRGGAKGRCRDVEPRCA
mmetsp:Transcript_59734/g.139828  ORF Transcript_59734/g.139828 Transcript_59734/m.139828 type:complete len:308 (+) Transcript_59734:218-1141(+)